MASLLYLEADAGPWPGRVTAHLSGGQAGQLCCVVVSRLQESVGGSCKPSSSLASKVAQPDFCHNLLVKASHVAMFNFMIVGKHNSTISGREQDWNI